MCLQIRDSLSVSKTISLEGLTSLFAILFLVYGASLVVGVGFPIIEVMWSLLVGFLLLFVNSTFFLKTAAVFFIALLFFTAGLAGQTDQTGLAYVKLLFVGYILTTLVGALSTGNIKTSLNIRMAPRFQRVLHRFTYVAGLVWAIYTFQFSFSAEIYDARDLTGLNYLTPSDLITVFGISFLSNKEVKLPEFVLCSISTVVPVILLGSRAALLLYIFTILFLTFNRFSLKNSLIAATMTSMVLFGATTYLVASESVFVQRFATFGNIFNGKDESANSRVEFFDNFVDVLNENPFCVIVPCFPEDGHYAHNIMSTIEYFGLLGVIFTLSYLPVLFYSMTRVQTWLPVFLYCSAALIVFRFAFSLISFIGLGFYISTLVSGNQKGGKAGLSASRETEK